MSGRRSAQRIILVPSGNARDAVPLVKSAHGDAASSGAPDAPIPNAPDAPSLHWPILILLAVLAVGCGGGGRTDREAGAAATAGTTGQPSQARVAGQRDPGSSRAGNAMQKQVSPRASFVIYAPTGWKIDESADAGACAIAAADASGALRVTMAIGPAGGDAVATARAHLASALGHPGDLSITNALSSPDRGQLVADGAYTDAFGVRREFRCWAQVRSGESSISSIAAPEGTLARNRETLLTVLANVRVMKGVFADKGGAGAPAALQPYRMRDGSASFGMPAGWRCQEQGAGSFIAGDTDGHIFMVGSVDVVTPQLGFTPPGGLVSAYLPPSRAWEFITARLGLARDLQYENVTPRPDLTASNAPNGPLSVEDFVYTCTSREGNRLKGYTLGMSLGGGAGLNWSFKHISVFAPAESFDDYVPTFVAMLTSYRIDDAYARTYVQQGMARLREMQRQTSALIRRNADEIHAMMQAAYDERQRSEEYIDYQRTSYIRGESDWISEMEGGAIYHTDTWGTQNTATGEYYEGAPYDYVHFEGQNPKYDERMQPIDNRELYEKYRP